MNCWQCKTELIWGCDYAFEEVFLDGDGIVSVFSCPNENCNAEVEVRLPFTKKKNKRKK